MTAALENNIVLRKIFTCLPLSDLKQCRLMNRTWNFEAVSVIRDFRLCTARIWKQSQCSDLLALAEVVSGMSIVPINILSIRLYGSGHSDCQPIPANILSNLLEALPLQGLQVSWEPNFRPSNCAAISFVTELISRKIMELSTLEFTKIPDHFLTYFGEAWTPWLPKLITLDLQALQSYPRSHGTCEFFLKIISGAPNLKKITGTCVDSSTLQIIPEDKTYLLDYFRLSADSDGEVENCSKLALAGPVLSELYIIAPYIESMLPRMGSYIQSLEKILASSCKSLKSFTMAAPVFPLDLLNFPPLIYVQNIGFSTDVTTPHILHVIQSIDYPELLPTLYRVEVVMDFDPEEEEDDPFENPWEDSDAAEAVQVHPSTTVKHLHMRADFNLLTFKELSHIFPNVVHFDAVLRQPIVDPAGATSHIDLWAAWPYLESVYLVESREAVRLNFDAEFLGISKEEVEILRQFDDESLEKMNIVPTRPSVLTLLRKIKDYHDFLCTLKVSN